MFQFCESSARTHDFCDLIKKCLSFREVACLLLWCHLRVVHNTGGEAEGGADVSGDFPQQEGCPLPMHELILCCFTVDEAVRPDFKQLVDNFEGIGRRNYIWSCELPCQQHETGRNRSLHQVHLSNGLDGFGAPMFHIFLLFLRFFVVSILVNFFFSTCECFRKVR